MSLEKPQNWRDDIHAPKTVNKSRLALLLGSVALLAVGAAAVQGHVWEWVSSFTDHSTATREKIDLPPMQLAEANVTWSPAAQDDRSSLLDRATLMEINAKLDLLASRLAQLEIRFAEHEEHSHGETMPELTDEQLELANTLKSLGISDEKIAAVIEAQSPITSQEAEPLKIVERPAVVRETIEREPRSLSTATDSAPRSGGGGGRGKPSEAELARKSPLAFAARLEESEHGYRIGGNMLPTGHQVTAILATGINSETPGLVKAIVTSDPAGRIPTGAVVIGSYDGRGLKFSSSRLGISFTEIQIAQRAYPFEAFAGDTQGRSGVAGDVDRQIPELVGLAALNIVSGAAVAATAKGDDFSDLMAYETVRETSRSTREFARETVSTAPTIDIPPGEEITIILAAPFRTR